MPALNTPQTVASYTATGKTLAQLTVDLSALSGADVLNIKVADNTTGNMRNFVDADRGPETEAAKSYMVLLDAGDSLQVVFEQTAGTQPH